MWLSERRNYKEENGVKNAVTTISGETTAAMTDGELRNIIVVAPGGYGWKPDVGTEILIMKSDGQKVAAAAMDDPPVELSPGEAAIYSKGAVIHIKNSGEIEISGSIKLSGKIDAAGGVYSNGTRLG